MLIEIFQRLVRKEARSFRATCSKALIVVLLLSFAAPEAQAGSEKDNQAAALCLLALAIVSASWTFPLMSYRRPSNHSTLYQSRSGNVDDALLEGQPLIGFDNSDVFRFEWQTVTRDSRRSEFYPRRYYLEVQLGHAGQWVHDGISSYETIYTSAEFEYDRENGMENEVNFSFDIPVRMINQRIADQNLGSDPDYGYRLQYRLRSNTESDDDRSIPWNWIRLDELNRDRGENTSRSLNLVRQDDTYEDADINFFLIPSESP